jgi:hydroxypyruvate isomerase
MCEKPNARRKFVKQTTLGMGALMLSPALIQCNSTLRGNIKQAVAAWPFMAAGPKWSPEAFLNNVSSLGAVDVELFPVEHWAMLKKYNMVCAATKSHTFVRGMNNKNHHAECFDALEKAMEVTSAAGFPNVMTFTGLEDTTHEKNGSVVGAEEGLKNCIEGYKKMVRIAEKKKVTIILEPLNSRATEHMKGHPGYQGDHIDHCMEIIKAVSSPAFKLLFDVYHVQIMDGNIIANINKYIEYIAHVQVAGNPGRGEIGDKQEINYKAVMQAFLDNGYNGYIGHEWIPTGDAMTGLREAIGICDI